MDGLNLSNISGKFFILEFSTNVMKLSAHSIPAAIFFLAVVSDLLTKMHFLSNSYDLGWLQLHLVKNTGASFGLFKGMNIVFIILSFVALGVCAYYYAREYRIRILLAFLGAGIVGNLVNRIMYGYVIDFIDLGFWPVFNIADSLISIGVIVLALSVWKSR